MLGRLSDRLFSSLVSNLVRLAVDHRVGGFFMGGFKAQPQSDSSTGAPRPFPSHGDIKGAAPGDETQGRPR